MFADLQVVSPSLGDRTPLEAVLGDASGRYFGAGYRNVNYSLGDAHGQDGSVAGLGRVRYPAAWSTDGAGTSREPHLSSIDAVLLPLAVLEQGMSQVERLDAGRLRITGLHLAAGNTPFTALDAVPIRIGVEKTEGGQKVHALVGNIKVGLTFAEAASVLNLGGDPSSSERVSVYSELFRQVESTSWIRHTGKDRTQLTGEHELTAKLATAPSGGFEALQWPAPSLIDYLVIMGQLTQALVYAAAGRQRANSGPLWMRTIDISLHGEPTALPVRFYSGIQLLRDRPLQRRGVTVHDCKVEASASTDVSAVATLAYQEL